LIDNNQVSPKASGAANLVRNVESKTYSIQVRIC